MFLDYGSSTRRRVAGSNFSWILLVGDQRLAFIYHFPLKIENGLAARSVSGIFLLKRDKNTRETYNKRKKKKMYTRKLLRSLRIASYHDRRFVSFPCN